VQSALIHSRYPILHAQINMSLFVCPVTVQCRRVLVVHPDGYIEKRLDPNWSPGLL
jgi:hypothetical protein